MHGWKVCADMPVLDHLAITTWPTFVDLSGFDSIRFCYTGRSSRRLIPEIHLEGVPDQYYLVEFIDRCLRHDHTDSMFPWEVLLRSETQTIHIQPCMPPVSKVGSRTALVSLRRVIRHTPRPADWQREVC
jgi:hypothetical protein